MYSVQTRIYFGHFVFPPSTSSPAFFRMFDLPAKELSYKFNTEKCELALRKKRKKNALSF